MSRIAQVLEQRLGLEQRVDLNTGDLSAGGAIPAESAKKFISTMYNATPLLSQATQMTMNATTMNLPNIGIGRVLKKDYGGENAEVPTAKRVKPTTGKSTITAEKLRGRVDISYDFLEDNIEKEGFQQSLLMEHIAPAAGRDLADSALNADQTTVEVDDDTGALSVHDGWLVQVVSNVVDAGGAGIDSALLHAIYKAMPAKFIDPNPANFKFFPSRDLALDWAKQVSDRMTPAGDRALSEGDIPPFRNRPVIGDVNIRQENSKDRGIFCDPKNLVVGVHSDIRIKVQDWPDTESVRIYVSVRCGFALYLEEAAVKFVNVTALS